MLQYCQYCYWWQQDFVVVDEVYQNDAENADNSFDTVNGTWHNAEDVRNCTKTKSDQLGVVSYINMYQNEMLLVMWMQLIIAVVEFAWIPSFCSNDSIHVYVRIIDSYDAVDVSNMIAFFYDLPLTDNQWIRFV